MSLFMKRVPKKKRRSQTRLGTTNEAEAAVFQFTFERVQFDWKSKLERIPGVIIAGALCYVLIYFFTDYRFFVYQATITGHDRISAREVYEHSGVEGESIFFLNRAQIRERLEELPDIKTTSITLQLPANVKIDIVERNPVFIWQAGQTVYWVDDEGVIMEPRGEPLDTVTFLEIDGPSRHSGERIQPEILQAARILQDWLPQEQFIQWSQSQGISFLHPDGYPVYLGQPDDLPRKLTTLHALTESFAKKGTRPEFVDMRFAGRPYYR